MMEEVVLRNVSNEEEANALMKLLAEHGIESRVALGKDSKHFILEGYDPSNHYEVRILQENKAQAEELLAALAAQLLETDDPDYYLHAFTNDELLAVLASPYEWSEYDVLLSKKILSEREALPSDEELARRQRARAEEINAPEKGNDLWIIAGYATAVLGGFFGILLGYAFWKSRRTLPNGTIVPRYAENIRSHGKIIFFLSTVIFIVFFTYQMGRRINAF